jgi:hypothetical protein
MKIMGNSTLKMMALGLAKMALKLALVMANSARVWLYGCEAFDMGFANVSELGVVRNGKYGYLYHAPMPLIVGVEPRGSI